MFFRKCAYAFGREHVECLDQDSAGLAVLDHTVDKSGFHRLDCVRIGLLILRCEAVDIGILLDPVLPEDTDCGLCGNCADNGVFPCIDHVVSGILSAKYGIDRTDSLSVDHAHLGCCGLGKSMRQKSSIADAAVHIVLGGLKESLAVHIGDHGDGICVTELDQSCDLLAVALAEAAFDLDDADNASCHGGEKSLRAAAYTGKQLDLAVHVHGLADRASGSIRSGSFKINDRCGRKVVERKDSEKLTGFSEQSLFAFANDSGKSGLLRTLAAAGAGAAAGAAGAANAGAELPVSSTATS